MQFNFNFEAFEKSGKEKSEAINYLKGLNSSLDFDKLESDLKGDENAIYEALKGGNFSFSKPSIEQTRQKLLKNKENEALKAEFNTSLSWLDNKQDYNFYDFKKAKERANSKQGLIKADLEAQEKELKRKEALFEKRLKNESIFTKSLRDTADNLGLNAVADTLEMGLNKLGFKDENYIFESEKEDIKKRALKGVREKLQNNEENFSESEKYALRDKYDELDYKKALEKEKEKLRLIQKDSGYNKSEVEFMEEELGFFHTLFNEAKDTVREFKDEYKSEGVIGADVQKAVNVLKQFEESELLRHIFSDKEKKQELQQEYLKNALVIAELNGFDDVGLSRENELYFIKKDKDKEQKYLVNTGFLDNFWDLIENAKFEIAGAFAGGAKGFNSGKSAKGKVVKSILGAAAGSFGGALMDAKIADMYLNRESNYKRNLEYALQAGLLSIAGDGVIIAAKPMAKGVAKGVKNAYAYAKERTPLGLFSTIPSQNINAANKIIDEVFTPEMKEELKQAQKEYGGSVRGEDLANPVFEKLKESFVKKYGKEDIKTQKIAKLAEIFNQNSLKTKQQEMLDLIRSDKDGSTLAYLLEVAKDDVKIQNNLKNMLNLASLNVEKNLKNLNINPREIKSILDEFEAGNKAAFKEVESQISKLYNEDIRVVLDRTQYENIKKDFLENGVNLDEMTPFLRDLENNVFAKEGVTFAKLNNFRKNLNFYIFNKDKTPNFINTLKKISETSLKAEIDKGIDNIFNELPNAYASIKELYSTSLKDYAAMKELNESIKNLKLQDTQKSADEVVDSLIKYAKGQGENGVNNLQKIKDYLGEENNAFLEMQILNRLFKESVVENDRAKVRVFDSEGFLNRVKELVGDTPAPLGANLEARALSGASQGPSKQENFIKKALNKDEAKLFLENLNGAKIPKKLDIEGFLKELESVENKENFISHLSKKEDAQSRLAYLNLVEPTLKEADLILHNGKRQDYIKKFNDGKDFFTLLITEENGKRLITFLPKTREDFIKNKIDNASLIQSFTSRASKQGNGLANESITQPLFKSKEAREFLELVEGFHKLYKNDAIIAKNFTQGTASQLSTSIATSAEGAIKQKVVKGGFDPIFRLLPDGVLFGLFSKQIQGGALRYHLRKALSRSLNYDDFKIKLEKELKRTNFNSNTSRLIDEFMQNLEDFNAEKEAKLARIREEEELQRAQELKRQEAIYKAQEAIYKAQEAIYKAQEANNLKDILEPELKEDFGVNFEGFKGKEAVLKLLSERKGQVKGAFYKEGLGEIDLVWGDENFGLRHILEQRTKQWGEEKALKFISHLNENIEKGQIVEVQKGRAAIKTDLTTIILDKKENNNFVLTAFRDRNNKKELESLNLSQSKTFTSENAEANAKESPVTSLNQESIIAQKAKNDEVLEAEVIEEVGLNEPMKFLEFQQRKLLTYIKENTPLRLLEHKKELKTRDILNFLEQSALNGKQKVFLMRNLERDLGKIELKIKENESVKAKIKNTYEISQSEAKELGEHFNFKGKKPLLRELRENEIKHALKSHGNKESEEARGNIAITLQDIEANYPKITQEFDEKFFTQKGVIYVKQVNGHHIVIEEALSGQDKLIFKTMWKTKGNYNKEVLLKNAKTSPYPQNADEAVRLETISKQELEQSNPQQSHLSTDESITQNSQEAKIKEAVKNHNAIYKEILDNDYIFTDERSKIFRKRERELIENLAKDEKVQAFTSQWGYPFKKDGKLHGVGLDYKAKVYGKGKHKMMHVSGGGFGSATQQKKEKRLLELEKERLQEAFKADFGIDGFISKYVENDFFKTLWRETSAYKGTDYGWGVDPREYYPYYENRIMPSDTITQAKEKLQKEKSNWSVKRQEAKGSEDIIFTDKKGKEHTLTKETQKAWLEAFGLKSLDEAYIPNFKAEVKEAINRVLGGEEIKLTKGSFEKLVKRDREEFLPYIKDTLEKANAVIKQVDGALIFAKDYRNERLGKFFASVSRNDEGEWIITSNAPKNLNNLKNKLNEGGELLYSDLPELTIIAKPDLDANALNSEANLKDIIPQKANLEAVNKQKDKEFLEAYEKADFKGKVELAKQDIDEEIKFLEKQKEEFKRIIQQKDYNDIELEQARKILENAKEEVEGHYRIKYMQNGKEMRAYISKTDYFNQGKILSKDEILHKIIQKTIYKDKIENIKKTSDKLKKQIKIIDEYLKKYGDNEAGAISDDIIEKFKYYDFAKNAGKGAVIIGERRKGLYEQAQKVLNSRFLKAKKRATQSKKNYNITYDEARKLFYKGDMSEEQKELFQSVLPIAQKLNVRIRTAIREPYEDMIKDTTNIAGMYRYELNTATLKKGGNYTDTQRAETLLHELIHSVTSRAMSLHKTPLRDKMLSKTQIKAIDEIDQIYKKLYKFKKTFKLQDENGADLYGIKNSHEMLAELANPMFSSKLKEIGLYEKLVNNIMKIILSVRDFIRLRSDKNVYEKLKQCLKDIIENYKDDFTQEYEKQNIRDFTLTSQTQKEQIYTQRQEIKNTLKAKINQAITNENTGEKAILTNKGISKMLSDKAISKSVDNGFSVSEHFEAVRVVDELFKRAKRAFSKRDEKDKNLSIYHYNAPFKNANALMTLKEYKQNGKRIYSLELENLEAAKFNPSGKDLAEQLSKSKDADTTTFHTPIDNPDESIAQKSDDIYHSNPHLGAGLVGGVLNGVEQDENGNLSFDPVKFAMGFLGGSGGSFALKKGFQILEKNPELKEKIINELADTLAQGFEKAREKYPLLSLLEPRYIVKNEKGRKIQAKVMLKEAEQKAIKQEKEALEKVLGGSEAKAEILKDLNNADEILAVLLKGYQKKGKGKGAEHIRLEHTLEPTQEGYLTRDELLDMGVKMREFIQKQGEPFMETNAKGEKARIYEWQDDEGVRFRIVTNTKAKGGNIAPSPLADEIITFYSDRNLKEKMNFKNPLLKDTIAESTMQGEALSKELEKSFLDESGRIAYKALIHKAEVLPQSLNLKGFKQMIFNNDKTKQLNAENALIKTPVGEVKVNVLRAFNHYMKNGKNGNHKENRQALNATFMPTLLEPKFVTRDEEGTMYYYKPFISKDKEYHITSIAVKKNGNLDYATSYNATENRLRQMIKHNKLVYEKD
ncbi:TPA: hypothetical protein R1X62_000808 [Campylobacter upsaliensis]|nr:hypothetical protein [Campylobacter upsaliensis]